MIYTILHASSVRNCDHIVGLDKKGNKYVVFVWNKATKRTERQHEADYYENAEAVFYAWCKAFDMTDIKKVEHDPADFDFD